MGEKITYIDQSTDDENAIEKEYGITTHLPFSPWTQDGITYRYRQTRPE